MQSHIVSHHDLGDFIFIEELRIRKDLIQGYQTIEQDQILPGGAQITKFYLVVFSGAGTHTMEYKTKEEQIKAGQQLDWIYMKDQKQDGVLIPLPTKE